MTPIRTTGFSLQSWQQNAVDAWARGGDASHVGTLEVVTGGGKTLIALACAALASEMEPDLRLAIVVPTKALARQWLQSIQRYTDIPFRDVGLLGAGGRSTFANKRVLVAVLNTAAKRLPDLAVGAQPLMLIVDECHRAGAPTFSRVLTTPSRYRLGLSATPDREEVDDEGEPLQYDEQIVGRELGAVVFSFDFRAARAAGWLPEYTLHHHGVSLSPHERTRYEAVSRRIDEAADVLRALGGDTTRARRLAGQRDETGDAARQWVQLTGTRKDLLYRAEERQRVALTLVREAFANSGDESPRVILFHERVEQAVELSHLLKDALPTVGIGLEHSRLADRERVSALEAFANGAAPVLVSVKSLIEGIDVPATDTGISVASSSSVRQRVQALGRVLRRATTASGESKRSIMHLVYVDDTVDELIYSKADWSDLTGEDANRYWRWSYEAAQPEPFQSPPRTPRPTEEQAWEALGRPSGGFPFRWDGMVTGQEYSISTTGVVHSSFGRLIENTQGLAAMVESVRGRPGGRFTVTPSHRLVLVWSVDRDSAQVMLAGRLTEPFRVAAEVASPADFHAEDLTAGAEYIGPSDKNGGSYKLSQRAGGTIERPVPGGKEFAQTAGTGDPQAEAAATAILAAWDALDRPVPRFFVNSLGHAWYESDGKRRFLAPVPSGFAWPSALRKETQ
jgi:superfamily II DNA or RNA helicase